MGRPRNSRPQLTRDSLGLSELRSGACVEIRLRLDDTTAETLQAVPVAPNRYRLEMTTPFAVDPLYWGDVIETEVLADGTHRFLSVTKRAPLRHYSWVVNQTFVESPDYTAFARVVHDRGGHVEALLGGVMFAHVPLDTPFDAEAELDRYLSSDWR